MRLLEIPFSTNVERVTLALAHKGLVVEHVAVEPGEREAAIAASGQSLVPVLVLGNGEAVADSTVILRRLEADHPAAPLWPSDPARAAELDVFIAWFNAVWKHAPNAIVDSEAGGGDVAPLWAQLREHVGVFDALLAGRDFLWGDELSAADLIAFPFLKYAVAIDPADDERFHHVLHDGQPLEGRPRVAEWIARVDALPRA